jgi:hypothetical protein
VSTLKQMRAEKAQKSEDLAKIFDSVQDLSELSSDQKEEIKKRNDELAELGAKLLSLQILRKRKLLLKMIWITLKKFLECLYMESQKLMSQNL